MKENWEVPSDADVKHLNITWSCCARRKVKQGKEGKLQRDSRRTKEQTAARKEGM